MVLTSKFSLCEKVGEWSCFKIFLFWIFLLIQLKLTFTNTKFKVEFYWVLPFTPGTLKWLYIHTYIHIYIYIHTCTYMILCVCVYIFCCCFSHVQLFKTAWTAACQAFLSKGLSWKNTGEGCHFLLQGISPTQGSNSCLCIGKWILYHWATQKAHVCEYIYIYVSVYYMCAICMCVCMCVFCTEELLKKKKSSWPR